MPAALLLALYAKNYALFGDFAASTFGPASYTLVTVANLRKEKAHEVLLEAAGLVLARVLLPRAFALAVGRGRASWTRFATRACKRR